jgi:P27 family predicted phage terminase small subunit
VKPKVSRTLKVLRGTFRKGENPGAEPSLPPLTKTPPAPSYLNKWGRKKWKEMTGSLIEDRIITAVDIPALEICCDQYGIYCELRDAVTHFVDDEGTRHKINIAQYLAGKNSQTIPEYTQMRAAAQLYKTYAVEFGLTAASRKRIDVPERAPVKKDETEALLEAK